MPDWRYPALGGTQDVFFARATAPLLPTIVAGDGIYLIDARGRRLLDVCSGPFLAALGQGNERVLQAMLAQGRKLSYTYSRTTRHDANALLAERLASLAGAGFERAHLTSGGSEAVEMALKFLRAHAVATGQGKRQRVISMMPGYHGATAQTLGLNGDVLAPALWGPLTVLSEKIPAPLTFRAPSPEAAASVSLAALEQTIDRIGAEEVLAFVMEPIGGQASGVNVPHASFASGARAICDQHGIRLVFDESVSALRTGHFLAAHEAPDALPDVAVLAKGLGAGYAPLGAALMSAALVEELAATTGFAISHSYDANPIACAAGAAVLHEIVERDLIAHAERIGVRLRAGLAEIAHSSPLIGDVRGRGLLLAIELVADKETLARFPAEIDPGLVALRHGLDHGLLLYSRRQNSGRFGDWLIIAPPLVISEQECEELLGGLELTLAAAAKDLLDNDIAARRPS
ncbi:MAG: aminotransferase class III-fold pyridoxal phosphate-dependent enzyme [Solirubrobacteraceae bacterium]|jgi:adenosylmethionine-8-amino-7-oxononanoate aminotransferase